MRKQIDRALSWPRVCRVLAYGLAIAIAPQLGGRARADAVVPIRAAAPWSEQRKSLDERSEGRTLVTFAYALAKPARDLDAYIDEVSPRGFEYSVQLSLFRSWYIGAVVGYNRFYQDEGTQTYATENGHATATVYRSLTNVSLALMGRYHLFPVEGPGRLFAGMRLGVAFGDAVARAADFSRNDAPVGLLLTPEAGFTLRLSQILDAVVGYEYAFTTMSFRSFDRVSYHVLQAGLQLRY